MNTLKGKEIIVIILKKDSSEMMRLITLARHRAIGKMRSADENS